MDLREQLDRHLSGAYQIERELGGGGMSRVFLAVDRALGRAVVLKVVPQDAVAGLSADRFRREIALAARLQHPHIVPVLTAGDVDGVPYYTMPFVEGESLRERLRRDGELPVADCVGMLRELARALAYAHDRNIVHRDIKPDNILLSGGSVMVTDFGVAKAIVAAATQDDDRHAASDALTALGTSLGTPAYMAPEQVAGDPALDQRADVYALGCTAYELLTGQPPFAGRPMNAVLAAQVQETPEPLARRRPTTPPALAALVMQCLEKRPADRPQSAHDVLRVLDSIVVTPSGVPVLPAAVGDRGFVARNARFIPWTVAAVLALALAVFALRRPATQAQARSAFYLTLGDSAPLRTDATGSHQLAVSPDGSLIAYVGGLAARRLYLRPLGRITSVPIPGTDDANGPQFSPDGKWLAFVAGGTIKRVPVAGGPITAIADSSSANFAWCDGDVIVFQSQRGLARSLWRVAAFGGPATPLTKPDSARRESHVFPNAALGTGLVLFGIRTATADSDEIAVARVSDGSTTRLGVKGVNPRSVPGYIVFGQLDGTASAVAFDARHLRTTGPAVSVLENVQVRLGGAVNLATSPSGTIAYAHGQNGNQLVRVDQKGQAKPLRNEPLGYLQPRVSPDGRRIAVTIATGGSQDVWIHDIASGALTRLTRDGRSDRPEWTADGRRVAWRSQEKGRVMYWQRWDGSGKPDTLLVDANSAIFPRTTTESFFVANRRPPSNVEGLVRLSGDGRATPVVLTPAADGAQQEKLSPDGRWLAYVATGTGRDEIYMRSTDGRPGAHQISTGSGSAPVWSPDGRQLYYRVSHYLMSAGIRTTPDFSVERRDTVFDVTMFIPRPNLANYDVMPDNKSFVMIRTGSGNAPVVITGWTDELRERLAATGRR